MGQSAAPLFLDRINLHCEILPVPFETLADAPKGEPSAAIRARVVAARAIQTQRFQNDPGVYCNAQMSSALIQKYCAVDATGTELLRNAMTRYDMSARAYTRILRVARTIADLDASPAIRPSDIAEAISYRALDRASWSSSALPFA